MTVKMRERHIRGHAVKADDQVMHDGKWWVVVRPVIEGEHISWTDKNGDQSMDVGSFNGNKVLVKRGSHHKVLYIPSFAVVKIMRHA